MRIAAPTPAADASQANLAHVCHIFLLHSISLCQTVSISPCSLQFQHALTNDPYAKDEAAGPDYWPSQMGLQDLRPFTKSAMPEQTSMSKPKRQLPVFVHLSNWKGKRKCCASENACRGSSQLLALLYHKFSVSAICTVKT